MNTHGHHDVADEAGIPLLKEAFGEDAKAVEAFYLGNWLTDVSQAVDPVAYATASGKITGVAEEVIEAAQSAVASVIDEIFATLYEYEDFEESKGGDTLLQNLKEKLNLDEYAEAAKQRIRDAFVFFLASRVQERQSRIAAFFRNIFLVVGYYKFVHPELPGKGPKMDFEAFMRVFGRPNDTRGAIRQTPANDRPGAYTQYYPHEHLDRPELLPYQVPPIFSPGRQRPGKPFRLAKGAKRPGPRSRSRGERIEPDLYSYLRDHIEMTAGLLAEVDLAFEAAIKRGVSDADPAWYITMAKAGHALHQVEDFFAHSNWVEHAATRLGEKFLNKAIPPQLGNEYVDRAYTVYKKRLTRHLTDPLESWSKQGDEKWVVSGYFDFQDTAISLAHISEEAFGFNVADPYAKGHDLWETGKEIYEKPETVVQKARKLMRDTLDFVNQPKQSLEDPDNTVAKSLKDKFEPDIKKMLRPGVSQQVADQVAKESPLLQAAPPEIRTAFMQAIIEGSRVYTIGKTTMSIYNLVREISTFFANPIRYILDFLPGWIQEKVIDAFKFYAKERFYDAIGADRIGCHSLMAKDHGLEPFYEYQKHCGTAVHWYVVHMLTRWKRDAEGQEPPTYVDWLELLEYFLRNPMPPDSAKSGRIARFWVPATVSHITRAGDQLDTKNEKYSLTKRYRKTAFDPARFNWRAIADANFGTHLRSDAQTRNVVNATLRDRAWGYPVRRPNYAFKPGLRLLIPNQRVLVLIPIPAKDDPTWFTEVMEKKDWKVFRGREDEEAQESVPALEHHRPVTITRDQIDLIVSNGKRLRRMAREAYRPQ